MSKAEIYIDAELNVMNTMIKFGKKHYIELELANECWVVFERSPEHDEMRKGKKGKSFTQIASARTFDKAVKKLFAHIEKKENTDA